MSETETMRRSKRKSPVMSHRNREFSHEKGGGVQSRLTFNLQENVSQCVLTFLLKLYRDGSS